MSSAGDPVGTPADAAEPDAPDREDGPGSSRSVLRLVGGNALLRMVSLPVTAILGIVVVRLMIEEYGQGAYAQYALLVGIAALIPFADLGISASIMNAAAASKDPRSDRHLQLILVSCLRILSVCATVLVLLAVVLTATGQWDSILGSGLEPGSGATAAGLCLAVFGVGLTVSFGQRLLAGLGKYHWVTVLNGLQAPIVLVTLVLMIHFDVPAGDYVAVAAYVATFALGVCALWMANGLVRPTLSRALKDAVRLRDVRGARVFDTAAPMLIQMVAIPLAMQSDRLILSHVSTLEELTEYSLAAQMFTPVLAVVAAAATALWPVFARARAEGVESAVSPQRMAALFGVVALCVAGAIALLSGVLSELATGGEIQLGGWLVVSFTVLVVLRAVEYPLGTYLTDPRGLRFRALMVVLMLPFNVGLSLVLAERIGAVGPVIGSAISVAIFDVLASWIYIRKAQARDRLARMTALAT